MAEDRLQTLCRLDELEVVPLRQLEQGEGVRHVLGPIDDDTRAGPQGTGGGEAPRRRRERRRVVGGEGDLVAVHTEHLGPLLAEMQWLYRAHPGAQW